MLGFIVFLYSLLLGAVKHPHMLTMLYLQGIPDLCLYLHPFSLCPTESASSATMTTPELYQV